MIEILQTLLNDYFFKSSKKKSSVESKAESQMKTVPQSPSSPYAKDIEALRREYGELVDGTEINLSLQQALALMPRTRKRSDAYKGLQTELKRLYGVVLNVGKPHAYNSENEQESREDK